MSTLICFLFIMDTKGFKGKMGDLIKKRTEQHIIEVFYLLLTKKDFVEITVNEICKTADVSRTTFYSYFNDKYDLMGLSLHRFTELVLEESYEKKDKDLLKLSIERVWRHKDVFSRLLLGGGDKESLDILLLFYWESLKDIFNELKNDNVKFMAPIEFVAAYVASGATHILDWWVCDRLTATVDEMVEIIKKFYTPFVDVKHFVRK